jgi:hypothetical protein
MTDEDESTDPGMIGAERTILKFLRGREANEAIASHEGSRAAHYAQLEFRRFRQKGLCRGCVCKSIAAHS